MLIAARKWRENLYVIAAVHHVPWDAEKSLSRKDLQGT